MMIHSIYKIFDFEQFVSQVHEEVVSYIQEVVVNKETTSKQIKMVAYALNSMAGQLANYPNHLDVVFRGFGHALQPLGFLKPGPGDTRSRFPSLASFCKPFTLIWRPWQLLDQIPYSDTPP